MSERILLFIPMYNCEKQIIRVLEQLEGEIKNYIDEVIVVNNRSTDNGEQMVIDYMKQYEGPLHIKLLRNCENYGLGGSHKVAFNYTIENGFDYVIVLHGDDQGHVDDLLTILSNREYGDYDCLLGARFIKGSVLDGYSAFRTFGNRVYNILFSMVTHQRIYDLGSGLNMYSVKMLKDRFYIKYKDNLMFNYCMILGSSYYKHKIRFFPIRWSEEDQVSNVKMVNQAITVLKLLWRYFVNKRVFISEEHRDNTTFQYMAEVVFSNDEKTR